jgi:RNA polymerase sigma factor (TIGR02999 family)
MNLRDNAGRIKMSTESSYNNMSIEEILAAIERGDDDALPRLIEIMYPELKRLAHFQLARERPNHTLNTTAIVHEAYIRLAANNDGWTDRKHFLRAAATVMRHLLVDYARTRNAAKRGDGKAAMELDEQRVMAADDTVAVLALDNALKDISAIDPRLEQIIECRFFAGLTIAETAEALDMAVRTVERDWQRARGYLMRAMEPDAR